jgi:hypothetical protein
VSTRKPPLSSCFWRRPGLVATGPLDLPTPTHYRTCFQTDRVKARGIYDIGKVSIYGLDWVRRGGRGRQQQHKVRARWLSIFHPLSVSAPTDNLNHNVVSNTNASIPVNLRGQSVHMGSGPGGRFLGSWAPKPAKAQSFVEKFLTNDTTLQQRTPTSSPVPHDCGVACIRCDMS